MTDKRLEIRQAIDELVKTAGILLFSEIKRADPEGFQQAFDTAIGSQKKPKDSTKGSKSVEPAKAAKKFTSQEFLSSYQHWYSNALTVVRQLLPDRYDEFRALYRPERRKELDIETYGIADYLSGITVTRGFSKEPTFNIQNVMYTKFQQQISILASAKVRLDSILSDIKGVLEASLFDAEIDAARNLLKAQHIRSAGIVVGVVLERHLKRVVENHSITFRKTATLSNLNQALKDADVYDVPQWRRLQHLTDIRNLCGHSGDRDPTGEEVEDLILGAERVVRNIF